MSGWADECESCGDLHYEYDMDEVDGKNYCSDCAADLAREVDIGTGSKKRRHCPACGKVRLESGFTERMRGWVCAECSHIEEVARLGYCDLACKLCKGNTFIAASVAELLTGKKVAA